MPLSGLPEALEGLDGRRLACPVRTEEGDNLACIGVEADGLHGDQGAVTHFELFNFDRVHRREANRAHAPPLYGTSWRRGMLSGAVTRIGIPGRGWS